MRRWSQCFIPTLREAPLEARTISQQLLTRAGYIRQLDAGLSSFLFLGQRSMHRIAILVKEEMDRIGQEVRFPSSSCREALSDSLGPKSEEQGGFRRKDALGRDLIAADTDEKTLADIARGELRSYRQLPQIWYQVNTRFRDEPRANSGLLRGREFMVCDSYSLELDSAAADDSYRVHLDSFSRIFDRCGLPYVVVDASSNAMRAAQTQDFMVVAECGDDVVVSCAKCGYAANLEIARSKPRPVEGIVQASESPVAVETPTQKTIEEVAAFLGVDTAQVIKSYLAVATCAQDDTSPKLPVVAFLRGDHSVKETKLRNVLVQAGFSAVEIRPMEADEIRECFGLEPGFIGPVGLSPESCPVSNKGKWMKPQLFFDLSLKGRRNLIAGANKPGFHLRNVTPNETPDFHVGDEAWVDIRSAVEGEECSNCSVPLAFKRAVKIARLEKLSATYSDALRLQVTNESGREVAPGIGVYRIWLNRVLAACVETAHDGNGFWLSPSIAPFQVVVTATNTSDQRISSTAERIATALEAAGVETLLDDRDERPGVKFKDADLIGVPYRINVGKKIVDGEVEIFTRSSSSKENVLADEVVGLVLQKLGRRPHEG